MPTLGALKAELVMGVWLVARHRAVRVAALLGLLGAGLEAGGPGHSVRLVLSLGVVSVAASRVFAPGPSLHSLTTSPAQPYLVLARLGAVWMTTAPVLGVMNVSALGNQQIMEFTVWTAVMVGALVAGYSPWLGASAAASIGLFAAWWIGSRWPGEGYADIGAGTALVLCLVSLRWRTRRWAVR